MKTRSIDASFDPSGTRLVTAGDDATVRIWSASDGSSIDGPGSPAESHRRRPVHARRPRRDRGGPRRHDCAVGRRDRTAAGHDSAMATSPDRELGRDDGDLPAGHDPGLDGAEARRSTFSTCPRVDWPLSPGRWHPWAPMGSAWPSLPTAAPWRPPARMACTPFSTTPTTGKTQVALEGPVASNLHPGVRSRWPHPRRGRRSAARFGSGTSRRDPVRSRSSDIRVESGAWRSHPTAARWRPPAVTARSGSGMRGVDRTGPSSAGWQGSRCIRITRAVGELGGVLG